MMMHERWSFFQFQQQHQTHQLLTTTLSTLLYHLFSTLEISTSLLHFIIIIIGY
jgi:hypothetical protein